MEKNRDKMFDTPDFEKKTLGKRRERGGKNTLEGNGGGGRQRSLEVGKGRGWRRAKPRDAMTW